MDITTALRPAQKFITAAIVAAVTATCLVSATAEHPGASPASHVQAKKEYQKKEYSVEAKKEYRNTPDKKEYAFVAKKEYRITPDKKEYAATA